MSRSIKIFHGFDKKFIKGDIYGGVTAGIIALPLGLAWGAVSGLGPLTGIYSSIIVGTNNKKIIFEKQSSDGDKIFFEFKDTLPFVLSTLKKALKDYKCQIQKKELDIANYTFEMYQNRTDWIEYLEYDVKGLAELSMRINDSLMDYGESITTCLGAPSFAWKLMRKLCYNSDYFYCPKSPSLKKFMRQACYGGRILQWKKLFDPKTQSKMICLDFNSLYPSAMHKFSYPVGMAEPIVKPDGPIDDIKIFKDYLFSKFLVLEILTILCHCNTRSRFYLFLLTF